jgi:hypothetical protein
MGCVCSRCGWVENLRVGELGVQLSIQVKNMLLMAGWTGAWLLWAALPGKECVVGAGEVGGILMV